MSKEWVKIWSLPTYEEWATETSDGNQELHIIRKEPGEYFVVRAKLIFGETGLPGFEVIEEHRFPSHDEGLRQIKTWKDTPEK